MTEDDSPLQSPIVRCAIWVRFPTGVSAEEDCAALREQEDAGLADIQNRKAEGWVHVRTFCDSRDLDQTCKRTGLLEAISAAERGEIDLLIIHKMEHLLRSREIAVTACKVFESFGVRMFSHREGIYAKRVRKFLEGPSRSEIAEFERFAKAYKRGISQSPTTKRGCTRRSKGR